MDKIQEWVGLLREEGTRRDIQIKVWDTHSTWNKTDDCCAITVTKGICIYEGLVKSMITFRLVDLFNDEELYFS